MSQPGTSPDNKDSGVKSALLNELKIDRKAPVESSGRSLRWLLSASVLLGIGFAGWFFTFPPDSPGLMVNTALARSAASVDSGSSVLDATGYVVARGLF